MDTLQTTLIKDADAIWTRIMRLVEDLASGSFSALMKEVRAFEARVRMWLFALALELPAAPSISHRKSSHRRIHKPGPTMRKRCPRLGLQLFPAMPQARAENAAALAPKPRAKPDDNERFLRAVELFHRFDELRSTLKDPSAALAKIVRKRQIKSAPPVRNVRPAFHPSTDHSESAQPITPQAAVRRSQNLPRPDS